MTGNRKRGTAARDTADKLRQMILNGEFARGEPLRQAALAKQLGVSRVPLREAFHLLETEGLVTLNSNRGAEVARFVPHEVLQYQEIRARLETWLLELAIPLLQDKDIEKASNILKKMDNSEAKSWGELNLEFHCALYGAANRPYIVDMVKKMYWSSYHKIAAPIFTSRDRDRSQREHHDILAACIAGDIQGAVDRLEPHILLPGRMLVDYLQAAEDRKGH